MEARGSEAKRKNSLADLDALDHESLKALVLAQQPQLVSHEAEIENLKLLVLKLKRMHFSRARWVKMCPKYSNTYLRASS